MSENHNQLDSSITEDMRSAIIRHCMRDIVPDENYIRHQKEIQHESEWFNDYFSFLKNKKLAEHLGEAFFQARFVYKLMESLNLNKWKNQGIIKFQILQYASICEALIINTFEEYILNNSTLKSHNPNKRNISRKIHIQLKNKNVSTIQEVSSIRDLGNIPIYCKSEFLNSQKIINYSIKCKFDNLYEKRNNVHILKAVAADYFPSVVEAIRAFKLMQDLTEELKSFYNNSDRKE